MEDIVSGLAFFVLISAQCVAVMAVSAMKTVDGANSARRMFSSRQTLSAE